MFVTKFLLILFLYPAGPTIPTKEISFSYSIEGNYLACTVHSTFNGWVAIAFNTSNKLEGSNLIMGASENGFFKMSDRFILAPGNHKSVLELGVNEAITNRNVSEDGNGTTMTFKINRFPKDQYHISLIQGKKYIIHLASSESDDFHHHSRIRFSKTITL